MTTFSQWLVTQKDQATPLGALGRLWFDSAKTRPRTSGVEKVSSWLAEHAGEAGLRPEAAMEVLTMAAATYRDQRAGTASAVPGIPADVAERMTAGQRADAMAGNAVIVPPGGTQPPIPAAELPVVAAIVSALMPVMERLDQRLKAIEGLVAVLGVDGPLDALLAWTSDQDKRIEPITRLLADLGEAEDQADQLDGQAFEAETAEATEATNRAQDIARANGWLPAQEAAPEPAQEPVSLYGGHVVDTTAAWQAAYDAAPAGEDPA